ncbi:DNA methyltransferase [Spirosoma sp. SC4-14]|uniref:class I SAM-dependent DNA methyltransferase n=1 Tax=Spirosoma sp. SC4-14 TaxID=3128900 RepID=UPI0030CF6A49
MPSQQEISRGGASIGRIDLYKRGCFVLETKQGTNTPDQQKAAERAELGLAPEKRRQGHAVRGTTKWGQMMQTARQQALRYVRALPASEPQPLFVLVIDVGYCIDLYSNFAGVGDQYVPFPDQTRYRLPLSKLAEEETRAMLRQIWTDPRELDPSRRAARVTRELAEYLAKLSTQLEKVGHAPDLVAQFLMRCLFTMFSEDVGLIPKESFTGMLRQYAQPELRGLLPEALESLWHTMDTGGFSPDLKARLRKFNGKLFHDARALPLSADQIDLLLKAAEADWTAVEPAIFGTLLERALDPRERHSLGAHYTPRRYVERLVLPTVLEPLRREWAAAQAAAAQLLNEGKDKNARAELERFLRRLTSIKILDPACGSGNFLYVTLEHLKRLEGEVLAAINSYGQTALLNLSGGTTISPRQLLGLELNPRAAAIADVVLKIGYLQWHLRTHGMSELPQPLLDEYENIHHQDAVLQHGPPVARIDASGQFVTRWDGITTKFHPMTGQSIPDESARVTVYDYPNPRPAEWPQADFIVGNPPFVGPARMRDALGDGYTEALRKTYKDRVPDSADLVMYWWYNAAEQVKQGYAERFGFITTNSLKQTFNRRVMQPFLEGDIPALTLKFAIPDHPWVESADGAAVTIAMTVAEKNTHLSSGAHLSGLLLTVKTASVPVGDDAAEVSFERKEGRILANLTIGVEVDTALPLKANEKLASRGFQLMGSGFIISYSKALELGLEKIPGLSRHIRPYRNGRDLTDKPRIVYVIDLFGLSAQQVLDNYPLVYQHVLDNVKPERDQNNRASYRDNWWVFGEPRSNFRPAIGTLSRYIATVETAKHRIFQFLDTSILPDNKLVAIALEDPFYLGVLSSRIHVIWTLATGSDLGGNTPVYVKSRSFDPFPFPDAAPYQQSSIRELAEQLDALRKRQQDAHPTLTLTDLYNVVEKLRKGETLSAKEQTINQQGLASVVLSLHQQIDAAVADAYGWPHDLPDSELLTRLVQLNHERAAEEAAGHIRYLRPEYQAPGVGPKQQLGINLPASAAVTGAPSAASRQEWPKGLAQQMQAVRDVVQQAGVPLNAKQVAALFQRTKPEKVQPLLDTLATLALIRQTPEHSYAL